MDFCPIWINEGAVDSAHLDFLLRHANVKGPALPSYWMKRDLNTSRKSFSLMLTKGLMLVLTHLKNSLQINLSLEMEMEVCLAKLWEALISNSSHLVLGCGYLVAKLCMWLWGIVLLILHVPGLSSGTGHRSGVCLGKTLKVSPTPAHTYAYQATSFFLPLLSSTFEWASFDCESHLAFLGQIAKPFRCFWITELGEEIIKQDGKSPKRWNCLSSRIQVCVLEHEMIRMLHGVLDLDQENWFYVTGCNCLFLFIN